MGCWWEMLRDRSSQGKCSWEQRWGHPVMGTERAQEGAPPPATSTSPPIAARAGMSWRLVIVLCGWEREREREMSTVKWADSAGCSHLSHREVDKAHRILLGMLLVQSVPISAKYSAASIQATVLSQIQNKSIWWAEMKSSGQI